MLRGEVLDAARATPPVLLEGVSTSRLNARSKITHCEPV